MTEDSLEWLSIWILKAIVHQSRHEMKWNQTKDVNNSVKVDQSRSLYLLTKNVDNYRRCSSPTWLRFCVWLRLDWRTLNGEYRDKVIKGKNSTSDSAVCLSCTFTALCFRWNDVNSCRLAWVLLCSSWWLLHASPLKMFVGKNLNLEFCCPKILQF